MSKVGESGVDEWLGTICVLIFEFWKGFNPVAPCRNAILAYTLKLYVLNLVLRRGLQSDQNRQGGRDGSGADVPECGVNSSSMFQVNHHHSVSQSGGVGSILIGPS